MPEDCICIPGLALALGLLQINPPQGRRAAWDLGGNLSVAA
jgi:hypothetical protein